MLANLQTFSLLGIDALPVDIEVDMSSASLPKTILVGLPQTAVKEIAHRVTRALVNSAFSRTQGRTVINLSPAESHRITTPDRHKKGRGSRFPSRFFR